MGASVSILCIQKQYIPHFRTHLQIRIPHPQNYHHVTWSKRTKHCPRTAVTRTHSHLISTSSSLSIARYFPSLFGMEEQYAIESMCVRMCCHVLPCVTHDSHRVPCKVHNTGNGAHVRYAGVVQCNPRACWVPISTEAAFRPAQQERRARRVHH